MPIHEFECKACGRRFEKLMLSADVGNPPCPGCEAPNTRKLMSACRNVTLKIPAGYSGGRAGGCTPAG